MKISVVVKAGSRGKVGLEEQADGSYEAYVREQPVEGKANAAVQSMVAKHFGVAKSTVRLVRGATSRLKVFEIEA